MDAGTKWCIFAIVLLIIAGVVVFMVMKYNRKAAERYRKLQEECDKYRSHKAGGDDSDDSAYKEG